MTKRERQSGRDGELTGGGKTAAEAEGRDRRRDKEEGMQNGEDRGRKRKNRD